MTSLPQYPSAFPDPAMGESGPSALRRWLIGITAVLMAAYWVTAVVSGRAWLAASVHECGPDSEPECGIFDGIYEFAFIITIVLCIAGVATLLGVCANQFGGHLAALILHVVCFCSLGITAELYSYTPAEVMTWSAVLAAINLVIVVLLFSHLATFHKPQLPERYPR